MSDDVKDTTIEQAARVLAEKYTSPTGYRNPAWDIDKPDDDVTNPYHLTVPMEERITRAPMVIFTDGDGGKGMAMPRITEIVDVLADAGLLTGAVPSTDGVVDVPVGSKAYHLLNELQAEVERLNLEIQGYQVDDGYGKGWEYGTSTAVKIKAERDELKARIDAALTRLDAFIEAPAPDNVHEELWEHVDEVLAVRAVLLGDQTENTEDPDGDRHSARNRSPSVPGGLGNPLAPDVEDLRVATALEYVHNYLARWASTSAMDPTEREFVLDLRAVLLGDSTPTEEGSDA